MCIYSRKTAVPANVFCWIWPDSKYRLSCLVLFCLVLECIIIIMPWFKLGLSWIKMYIIIILGRRIIMISRLLKQDFVKQGCVITEQLFGINYQSWEYQLKLSNLRLQNISSHQYYVVNCEDSIYNLLWIILCIAWCRSLVYSVHQQQRYCSLVPSQLYESISFSTFLSLQCLSWYNLVTTLHPIISYSFWNNRQGAHKPYRVCIVKRVI